ncbi:beta strand repeat-containing protein [Ereboglobus luteus]|uniref:beta strand repeat-containing protein n=1 Tax=Ereboglobus luteus TaxID=1796921 RepID=UPI001375017A|nr:autotransporter-associated beta strand repeat-containing protein [Ereboglobus luteus]
MEAQSTWQKTGNGTWGAAANWDNGVPNAADATAIISNDLSAGNHTIDLANPGFTVGTLSIEGSNATASTILIRTSTLTFAASGGQSAFLNYQGSNYITISSVINLLSDLTIQAGTDPSLPAFASKLTISGRIDGNGNTLYVNAGHAPATTTISGAITGVGTQLVKTGGGALVFSNSNNTFSGGLDISAGTVNTTLAKAAGAGTILGGGVAATGANYLGLGDIRIANTGVSLTINSAAGNFANQHATIAGGLITLDKGGSLIVTENDARTAFRLVLNSGTISGGSDAGDRGVLALNGADFVYNADGSGGSAFIDAPTLVFNTAQNTTAMSVTLNNTVMQSGLGLVRKTGANALTFAAGDTGTFVADEFVIESALGAITLNQTALDLANGITFSGANGIFTNQLTTTTGGQVSFGRADQLGASSLNIGGGVITNLLLNGHDQNFSSMNLGNAARLGLWFDSATPSTLGINGLVFAGNSEANPFAENFLSIYNWTGNPASHLGDGAVVSGGHTVVAGGGVDLSKIWFRGYAPGAVDLGGGVLAPVDFLTTTLTGGGNWFDFARWTLDIPDRAGTTVIAPQFGSETSVNLQGRSVTLGHLETSHLGSSHSRTLTFTSGTVIFDSGLMVGGTKMASTISGTGGVRIVSAIVLENDLVVTATGVVYANGDVLYGAALGGRCPAPATSSPKGIWCCMEARVTRPLTQAPSMPTRE